MVFSRGAVSVTEDDEGVLHLSLGEDISHPETEVFGSIHRGYLADLIAALLLYRQER